MANLALVFDVLAKDGASGVFRNVGDSAERAGKQTSNFGTAMSGAMKMASGALLGAGLIEGFKALYNAAAESERIGRLTAQVIKTTGGAANVSAKQVGDLAAAIAKKTGVDDEAIQSGQNLLLTFMNVRNEVGKGNNIFDQATQTITDMSVALGQDTSSSAIQLGKALNDPIKGVTALQRVGVSFTESQKDQIKTLVESGDVLGAQKIILAELGKEFGGAAEAASTPLGKLQQRVGDLAEKVGGYLVPIVDKASTFFMDKLLPALEDVGGFVMGVGIPAFQAFGTAVGAVASAFNALPGPLEAGVVALGAFALLKGPVTSAAETIGLKALYMKDAIVGAGTGIGGFKAAGAGLLGFLGGPWGLAIAGAATGLSLLVSWLSKGDDTTSGLTEAQRSLEDAIRATSGAIDDSVRRAAAKSLQDQNLLKFTETYGVSSRDMVGYVLGEADAHDRVAGSLQRYRAQLQKKLTGDKEADIGTRALIGAVDMHIGALDGLANSTDSTVAREKELAEATNGVSGAMAGTVAQTEEATKALEDWLSQLQGIGAGFVQPLSVYKDLLGEKTQAERTAAEETAAATTSSSDSWKDYVGDVTLSLDEYATQLEEQLTAQANWRSNIVTITQAGGIEVGQQLAAMGVEGAGLVQQMVDAIGTDQFPRLRDLMIQEAAAGGEGAAAALDAEMKVMAAIGAAGAGATRQAIAEQLGIGVTEVQRIADQYGVALATGINPILRSLGKNLVNFNQQAGRTYAGSQEFFDGGFTGFGGKYTPAGIVHAGEFVFTQEQVRRLGVDQLEAIANNGYAGGGLVRAEDGSMVPASFYSKLGPGIVMAEDGSLVRASFYGDQGGFSVPKPPSTAPYQAPISTAANAVMQKGFDEVSAWLTAQAALGGAAGGGALGSGWQSIAAIVQAAIPQARINSTYRPGDPGYHGRGKAVDFGFGSGPGGAGSAGLASINRFLHDTVGGNLAELIYDGLGDDRPDLKNGKPLTYSASTRAEHRNHVHAAVYDGGGILPPGLTFAMNGTGQNETIRTAEQEAALGGTGEAVFHLYDSDGALMGTMRGHAEAAAATALTAVTNRGAYSR